MSMLLAAKAFDVKVGNALRKLVLIKLADNANDEGVCWPSYQHIADQCEISKRSVINHIEELQKMRLVSVTHRKGEKGNSSNIYRICLDGANAAPLESTGVKGSEGAALPPSENAAPPDLSGLDPSEGAAPPSANDSLPSAGDALPPSAGAAPRTSHSSEPINEPVVVEEADNNSYETANDNDDNENSSRLFSCDLKPASSLLTQERFAMHLNWEPSNDFSERCRQTGVLVQALTPQEQSDSLNAFRSHHESKNTRDTQKRFDHLFRGWVQRDIVRKQSQEASEAAQAENFTPQQKRVAVTETIMDVGNTDW